MTVLGIGVTDRDHLTAYEEPPCNRHGKPENVFLAWVAVNDAERAYIAAVDEWENNPTPETKSGIQTAWDVAAKAQARYQKLYDLWMKEEEAKAADWEDEQNMYRDLRHGG